MTQGLQFSLLFSALDSNTVTDSAVFVPDRQDASYAEQAVAFRQVLESERQSKASNKGQAIAAQQVTKQKESNGTLALPDPAPNEMSYKEQTTERNVQSPAESEFAETTEDVAEQWLGLIRQSSDASSLLRPKAELANQIGSRINCVVTETLQEEVPNASLFKTAAYTLGVPIQQQSSLSAAIKQGIEHGSLEGFATKSALAPTDSILSVADMSEINPLAAKILDKQANPADKKANESAANLSQAKNMAEQKVLANTDLAADKINTPASETLDSQNAPLASALKNQAMAENTMGKTLHTRVENTPARLNQDESTELELGMADNPTTKPSATVAKPENTGAAAIKGPLNNEEHRAPITLSQEDIAATDAQFKVNLTANANQQAITVQSAAKTVAPTITGAAEAEANSKIAEEQPGTFNVNNARDPQGVNAVGVGGKNSNLKTAFSASESAGNESGKLNMVKASADTTEKEPQSEQNQQRQDGRQYNFNRLEVTVQSSNTPSPAVLQTAGLEDRAEANIALLRAEQGNSLSEQQNRPQSTTSTAPSLAAQLKQLNLQQQDAAGQLRERVQLMVRQNIQFAEIRLDPAELGQMQIRINLQQEQATVQFIVQQQHAKELLEQQMPRLRELLQQQGMQLSEGQVQQQAKDDRQAEQQASAGYQQQGVVDQDDPAQTLSINVKHSDRLVDYYA